jgi:hypothetical protein
MKSEQDRYDKPCAECKHSTIPYNHWICKLTKEKVTSYDTCDMFDRLCELQPGDPRLTTKEIKK